MHFWEESVTSNEFLAQECGTFDDYKNGSCKENPIVIMGENVDQNIYGTFFLTTNANVPFGRNGTI